MFTLFILYVADQEKSKDYYQQLLQKEPCLHVPGMTEFWLNDQTKLGLMPENGIATILKDKTVHPAKGNGIPRCEVYLLTDEADSLMEQAIKLGSQQIQPFEKMDWGHKVAYVSDLDGHILAFAKEI